MTEYFTCTKLTPKEHALHIHLKNKISCVCMDQTGGGHGLITSCVHISNIIFVAHVCLL